jgi:hypothetical protein
MLQWTMFRDGGFDLYGNLLARNSMNAEEDGACKVG